MKLTTPTAIARCLVSLASPLIRARPIRAGEREREEREGKRKGKRGGGTKKRERRGERGREE